MKTTHVLFLSNGKIQLQNDSITMNAIRISIVQYSKCVVDKHILRDYLRISLETLLFFYFLVVITSLITYF